MAGDIGIRERAIVLPPDASTTREEAARALESASARALHHYGPRVLIAEVPAAAESEVLRGLAEAAMGDRSAAIASDVQAELGPEAILGLKALDLRQSEKYAKAKATRPLAGENWDTSGASAPDASEVEADEAAAFGARAPAGAPTSTRLTGSVAVNFGARVLSQGDPPSAWVPYPCSW